jgi:hypothetical protein
MDPGLPMLTVPHPVTAVGGPGPPPDRRPEEPAVRTVLDYVLEQRIGGTDDTSVYRARRLPGDVTVTITMAADGLEPASQARVEARLRLQATRSPRLVELIDGGLDPGQGSGPVALVLACDDPPAAAPTTGPGPGPGPNRLTRLTRPVHPAAATRWSARRRRPSWRAAAMAVTAAVVVAVLVLVVLVGLPMSLTGGTGSPPGRVDAATAARARPPADPEPAPCPGATAEVPAGAVAVPGDLTGAGCLVTMVWWPDRALAERPDSSGGYDRFALGRPGDQLVLGDWDGDGRDTPALYSPRSGRVSRFDQWATGTDTIDATVVSTDAPFDGLAHRRRVAGHDVVEVAPSPADSVASDQSPH